jgi:hypothetical protein
MCSKYIKKDTIYSFFIGYKQYPYVMMKRKIKLHLAHFLYPDILGQYRWHW